ncbi:gamma-glutamylcyclotransferase family protein [Saccharospirillum salsuginis]|uniref:Gamma-glutamylcyclotransferase n=1 Tax=Saccharospirillum salsuginis TaxID=418750 RepID=A0A918KDH2_9GAMM|nr:gamma-glutamylcyclotransferase [Saccharospirillum salsuginis]GGX58004.1 gamma-glutamylcyclotransferase [Saccharospirillum salsuginis]
MSDPTTPDGKHRVVIYGSLKAGEHNHEVLKPARFLGEDELTTLALYDLGPYPGARPEPSRGVVVEVYAVPKPRLVVLDRFEGYRPNAPNASLYWRETIETRFGLAWVYLYNQSVQGKPRIDAGEWSGWDSVPGTSRFRR